MTNNHPPHLPSPFLSSPVSQRVDQQLRTATIEMDHYNNNDTLGLNIEDSPCPWAGDLRYDFGEVSLPDPRLADFCCRVAQLGHKTVGANSLSVASDWNQPEHLLHAMTTLVERMVQGSWPDPPDLSSPLAEGGGSNLRPDGLPLSLPAHLREERVRRYVACCVTSHTVTKPLWGHSRLGAWCERQLYHPKFALGHTSGVWHGLRPYGPNVAFGCTCDGGGYLVTTSYGGHLLQPSGKADGGTTIEHLVCTIPVAHTNKSFLQIGRAHV